MTKYKISFPIKNNDSSDLYIFLEPWADMYIIKPGETIIFIGEGGDFGEYFSLTFEGKYYSLWGWKGSIVEAYFGENLANPVHYFP